VLFGVLQMSVGLLLRWSNAIHEKSLIDIVCECLPMTVFMVCYFGYMDFMIVYKWVTPMAAPPSIINSLIAMTMQQPDSEPLWPGAIEVSATMVTLTMLAVPIIMIPKPLILLFKHKKKMQTLGRNKGEAELDLYAPLPGNDLELQAPEVRCSNCGSQVPSGSLYCPQCGQKVEDEYVSGHEGEEFEFGEIMIHQVIETIEYVLGTVSHTASYLRIWALSLAHQQLSDVFFSRTILALGLTAPFPINIFLLYLTFAAWFGITVAVLLGMDVLECFLHTLRLHWVEFQSKFYRADGYRFEPYNIRQLIVETDE